jgi:hypothetical protein
MTVNIGRKFGEVYEVPRRDLYRQKFRAVFWWLLGTVAAALVAEWVNRLLS